MTSCAAFPLHLDFLSSYSYSYQFHQLQKMPQFVSLFSFSLESEVQIFGWLNVGFMQRWKVGHTQLDSWVLICTKLMAWILNPS